MPKCFLGRLDCCLGFETASCNVFWIGQVWSIGGFSCPLWIRSCRTIDGVNSSLWETGYLLRLRSSHLSRSVQNHVQMNAILDYKPTLGIQRWDFNSFQRFKAVRLVNIVTGYLATTVGGDKFLLCYEWVIESFTQPIRLNTESFTILIMLYWSLCLEICWVATKIPNDSIIVIFASMCHGPAGVPRLATRCLCVLSTWLVVCWCHVLPCRLSVTSQLVT